VFGLERLDYYVYARQGVAVETDHKPLLAICKKSLISAPKRLQRMLLRLQRYNYDLVYRPETQLVLADTLSRAYPPATPIDQQKSATTFWEELAELDMEDQMAELRMVASSATIEKLKTAAATAVYQCLKQQVVAGWPETPEAVPADIRDYTTFADELTVADDFVFKGNIVVVPRGARDDILARLHISHSGVNGCLRRAQDTVFYPGIAADIKKLVSQCRVCHHQVESAKEPLRSHPVPSRPWERVGTDIFIHDGQDYLITVDYLSHYFEVDRLPSKQSKDVVYVLRQQFARHGIPTTVVSDNSPFGSEELSDFARKWQFEHITSSPNYSQSNGKAEAAVKMAKILMRKATEAESLFCHYWSGETHHLKHQDFLQLK